mmetsp:Transcript_35262/g.81648  ORF Transcript_35262/g.81648 Transcript_35262/m.81648 type:complete len:128 (-) Transcript_35262:496-879(-)
MKHEFKPVKIIQQPMKESNFCGQKNVASRKMPLITTAKTQLLATLLPRFLSLYPSHQPHNPIVKKRTLALSFSGAPSSSSRPTSLNSIVHATSPLHGYCILASRCASAAARKVPGHITTKSPVKTIA